MVEWSCTKERLNEKGPYIFVKWSCANKRNKSLGKLNSGRIFVHIASAKIVECETSISTSISLIYPVHEFSLKEMGGMGSTSSPVHLFAIRGRQKRGLENSCRDEGRHGVSTKFCLIILVFSVNHENQEAEGVQDSLV